jgi:type IV secretion system protein VirB5
MYLKVRCWLSLGVAAAVAGVPAARAQFAVIDATAVAHLISQAQTLTQQLAAARAQLGQVEAQYQSMTGNRGMQLLLNGTVRNYLPAQWSQWSAVLNGNGGYGALSAAFQGSLQANAVLTPQQLAALSPDERAHIVAGRQSVALLQALSQDALGNASGRFAAVQQLIDAIPSARDQKGILDLQARIGAEQGMLQNEQTKLQVLYQAALAQEWATQQRAREQVIAAQGNFATRFEPTPQ